MKNYSNNLWFGALKYPARWRYVMDEPAVMIGILVTLACCLFLFFKLAIICGLLALLTWSYMATKSEKQYTLTNGEKSLHVSMFFIGKKPRHHRYDIELQKAILRVGLAFGTDYPKKLNTFKIFGYDDSFVAYDAGFVSLDFFLYKTNQKDWNLISGKYYNGLFLGKKIQKNLFVEKVDTKETTATFLHGDTAVRFEIDKYFMPVTLTYDKNKASYSPVANSQPKKPDLNACLKIAFQSNGKTRLFIFGIGRGNVPMAFLIKVPYVYKTSAVRRNNRPIPVNSEDGSFFLAY